MTSALAAVLWDMDGTIVDTEDFFTDAARDIVLQSGAAWTDDIEKALVGCTMEVLAATLIAAGVDLDPRLIIDRVVGRVGEQLETAIPWKSGASELLRELRDAGVSTALVTMSPRVLVQQVVAAIPFEAFDVIVTTDDVSNGKPAPDAYLLAASLLEVDIEQCVAIEDSGPGVASAVAAGAAVIAVPLPETPLPDAGYVRWDSLVGRSAQDLALVHARARRGTPPVAHLPHRAGGGASHKTP
ncbi:HAD superfamily hydrolase (TIGR01509 family) [Microbacterium sp. SORGH_AS 1204]|uniref:HAD family hydrolase n=1 Tax=Microbacterium sp. SORGH_AS_1204 TaxID=3041785 RepID=UPI0027934CC2|nr:HAD family phosphatase [Microbacterium sp. SORGH_AS_1204]MDQ1135314.1 HAD superfamily hydrolase (TIGR01509 family) [Microbacterium sp. SORGH_AS_1204]